MEVLMVQVMALPIGVLMIGLVWFFLTKVFYRTPEEVTVDHEVIVEEKRDLGPISYEERWISVIFASRRKRSRSTSGAYITNSPSNHSPSPSGGISTGISPTNDPDACK